MGATVGYFFGVMFAVGGFAYICLGILWATRALKRWPRASTWSAAGVAALLGFATASNSDLPVVTALATLAAIAVVVWRGPPGRDKQSSDANAAS